jgi:hypothetical protein
MNNKFENVDFKKTLYYFIYKIIYKKRNFV